MVKNRHLLFSLFIYAIGFVCLRPWYQYLFSSDGVGYLAVTKHLANGDCISGINGYWSPLHSWLAIPFYKAGFDEFAVFIAINAVCGAGILIVLHSLLQKTTLRSQLQSATLFISIPILLSYAFVFDVDILLCLLLLLYTNLIVRKDLFDKPGNNILCGIIGSISYFAKTYAFLFFLVHFTIVQLIGYIQSTDDHKKKKLLRNLALGIGSFVLLASPWIYILSNRYHFVTIGYAGSLNYQWYLGFPQVATSNDLIAVPPYALTSFWENTWYFPTKAVPSFSFTTLVKLAKVILHNIVESSVILNSVSWFSTAIVFVLGVYAVKKRERLLLLLFSFIITLFTGYITVHIELRFIMAATFIILMVGVLLLDQLFEALAIPRWLQCAGWTVFAASFLFYPANFLQDMKGKGKQEYTLAKELQAKGVKGLFISSFTGYSTAEELAYRTGNKYAAITRQQFTDEELLAACKQKQVTYYFFFYKAPAEGNLFKHSLLYKAAEQEVTTSYPNLILLKLKN